MSTRQIPSLHPDFIEYAYTRGFFPMPHPETSEVMWFDPDPRAIIPLEGFHVSKSLKKSLRTRGYKVTFDKAFDKVVESCASREETWINEEFKAMYAEMFLRRSAHSVEVWNQKGDLVGGVFGLNFGGIFNGESMFSRETDASKIAMYFLVQTMIRANLKILEVQFLTPHLESLGAIGISKEKYHHLVEEAVKIRLPQTLDKYFKEDS